LKKRPGSIKDFFAFLETMVISLLKRYNIAGHTMQSRPGVFAGGKKICSMGTAVRRWVSYHGLALNLVREIDLFKYVNPCGYTDMSMTSVHLETKSSQPDMTQLKKDFQEEFSRARKNYRE
ncbi:MAG: lipoyl protein ligase domain-containing protein, partial [Desulfonatronovibrionaceae bacterium]